MGANPSPLLVAPSAEELRTELVALVERDLLGPAGGDNEVLPRGEQPRDRYLVGMLAPRGHRLEPDLDEALASGDESEEDGDAEPEAAQESLFPSSLGLSFRVDGGCETLRVSASWGRYERVDAEDGETGRVWQRVPCGGSLELALTPGNHFVGSPDLEAPDVRVEAVVRPYDGQWSVTLFLRNSQADPDETPDRAWLFQAGLAVEAPDGSAVFVARPDGLQPHDREDQRLAVGYRHRVEHAVGHNVAVHVTTAPDDSTRAVRVETTSLPGFEVAQMRPPSAQGEPLLAALELDMQRLGDAADGELVALLEPLAAGYGEWLQRQAERLEAGSDGLAPHAEAGRELLVEAQRAQERIATGIALLGERARLRAMPSASRTAQWRCSARTPCGRSIGGVAAPIPCRSSRHRRTAAGTRSSSRSSCSTCRA